MNQLREELHESIGDPPVSTIDIDRTIARMRRVVRTRAITGTAGTLAAVVGVSFGLVTYVGTPSTGDAGIVSAPTNPPPSASPTPIAPVVETEQAMISRLNGALGALVTQAMPTAQFVPDLPMYPVGAFEFIAVRVDGQPATAPFRYLQASADVHDSTGVGSVELLVTHAPEAADFTWTCRSGQSMPWVPPSPGALPGKNEVPPPGCTGGLLFSTQAGALTSCDHTDDRASCAVSTGPHGEKVIETSRVDGTSLQYQVDIIRVDGSTVTIYSANWGKNGATNKVSAATRPAPPLTSAQLIAIGCDPSLAIKP